MWTRPSPSRATGKVVLLQEIAQADQGGPDLVPNDGGMGGAQPGLIRGGDALGKGLDRPVQRRALHPLLDLDVELVDDVADDQLGLDDAARHPLTEAADRLVDELRILAVPLQVVLVIRQRLERRRPLARSKVGVESMKAEEMIDRPHCGQRQELGRE
jgi:hypothetical protein